MNQLNLMKRLLWITIAMLLLQPVFSSFKSEDHSSSIMPVVESTLLEVASTSAEFIGDIADIGDPAAVSKYVSLDDSDDLTQHHHQAMDCCQTGEMSSCLIGCYFIAFAHDIEIAHLKTTSPLAAIIGWFSYQLISENPPPRIVI